MLSKSTIELSQCEIRLLLHLSTAVILNTFIPLSCSCALASSKEREVDEEANRDENNNPAQNCWSALSVLAFPQGTQEVHRIPVAEPECSEQNELLFRFILIRELLSSFHLKGGSSLHLQLWFLIAVGGLDNLGLLNSLVINSLCLIHLLPF